MEGGLGGVVAAGDRPSRSFLPKSGVLVWGGVLGRCIVLKAELYVQPGPGTVPFLELSVEENGPEADADSISALMDGSTLGAEG